MPSSLGYPKSKVFGCGYHPRIAPFEISPIWQSPSKAPVQCTIDPVQLMADQHKPTRDDSVHRCFFGHDSAHIRRQRTLASWRKATFDSILCKSCYDTFQREVSNPGVSVRWLATAPPPQQCAPRQGPCSINAKHRSSAQGSSGGVVWRSMPAGILWKDVAAGSTLCQKCYLSAWRCGRFITETSD